MDLNEKIIKTLEPTGLSVDQDEHSGKDSKYIIFTYEDEHPKLFGDNKPIADTVNLQIQLITPKEFKYMELKHQIRNLLEAADFSVTSIQSFLGDVASGTNKTRQTVFSVEYTEEREEE